MNLFIFSLILQFAFYKRIIFMSDSTNLLLQGHEGQIITMKYNHSGRLLASGGMDRNIMIWDSTKIYENTSVLKSHTNAITTLTFSSQDILFAGSADKNISAWDVQYQKLIRKYKGHNAIVHSINVPFKNNQLLASVGDDNMARVWDQRSKRQIWICKTKFPLTASAFSWNGQKLYVGGIDNEIKILNIQQQKIEEIIEGHQDTIGCLQVSPDGHYLMSTSFDQTIKIWDIRNSAIPNQRFSKSLTGHLQGTDKSLIKAAWSHDGLYVSCGSIDKCVYIWDINTKKIVQKLGGHTGTVNQVDMSFINKKSYLASCSNDKNIIISQLPDIFL